MEWLYDSLVSASPSTVYYSLAGVLLLCGLGLPIPEDISLITAGALAYKKVINVHTAFFVCFGAVLGGDTLAFLLGRFFGPRVLASRLFKNFFTPKKQIRVKAYFRKYGSKVMFVGRFLPGLRFTIYFSAGILKVRFPVFFVYDALAAILSVPLLVYGAFFFGDRIDQVISWARRSEYGILVVVALVAALIIFKTWRRRKARRLAPSAPAAKPAAPPAAAAAPAPLPRAEIPSKAP
jgi:membrane protein DedA with SNARE-associated domain